MVVVLALVWGAFLVWWLRSRAPGTFGDSVGTFKRHLRVLERTAPATVRPANRLRGPQPVPAYRPPVGVAGPPRPSGRQAQRLAAPTGGDWRRRQTLKRRRDVLFLLAVAVVATLAMAAATRASALIGLQVVTDAATASYVALLVRLRNLAAERDLKVAYLPPARSQRASAYDTRHLPAGGYRAAGGRGLGGGYGDLAVRRAVN